MDNPLRVGLLLCSAAVVALAWYAWTSGALARLWEHCKKRAAELDGPPHVRGGMMVDKDCVMFSNDVLNDDGSPQMREMEERRKNR
ncbi:hypothetical protein T484DRAFT_1908555 [Baffinella frigidus]|nr:hypothetical protein T484DRAFT_1908555 [Cryptophyta sp. CCMP2293]